MSSSVQYYAKQWAFKSHVWKTPKRRSHPELHFTDEEAGGGERKLSEKLGLWVKALFLDPAGPCEVTSSVRLPLAHGSSYTCVTRWVTAFVR